MILVAALDAGAGAGIVTGPMLLAGLGVGALASQLGSVTVSSVSDEQSGEVGGLQNTITNLGISVGTALTGAIVIAALTSSLLTRRAAEPAVPAAVKSQATTQLAGGVPFISDEQLEDAGSRRPRCRPRRRRDRRRERELPASYGLRTALSVLAIVVLIALFFSRRLPDVQPGSADRADDDAAQPGATATLA